MVLAERIEAKIAAAVMPTSKGIAETVRASMPIRRKPVIIIVLVRKENVEDLLKNMKEKYYQPRGLPLATEVCISTEGAGVLV